VGGNASKPGLIDALFDMKTEYLLVDEIEHETRISAIVDGNRFIT
jgi:hypothetical protein